MNEVLFGIKDVLVYIAMFTFVVLLLRILAEVSCVRKRLEQWVEADTVRAAWMSGQQQFERVYEERNGKPYYLGEDGEWHELAPRPAVPWNARQVRGSRPRAVREGPGVLREDERPEARSGQETVTRSGDGRTLRCSVRQANRPAPHASPR